jgi:hypothetical protein
MSLFAQSSMDLLKAPGPLAGRLEDLTTGETAQAGNKQVDKQSV